MSISVIIPTFHRLEALEQCLNCLLYEVQQFKIDQWEIIVSDDGTTSSSRSLIEAKFPQITWIEGPRKGPAANRNNGARYCKGEWILFTDDDCRPQPGLISNYLDCISKNPNSKVFEGKTIADRDQKRFDEDCPINLSGGFLWSCNFCIKKELFTEIGGFDENFHYAAMEDVDLRVRVLALGEQIVFCENAVVMHPWVIRNKISVIKNHFISTLVFVKKHPEYASQLNGWHYFKWIYKDFTGNLLKNAIRYKFKGTGFRIRNYLLHLRFSAYFIFNKIL